MEILILSGLSGSGKSTAIKFLEDIGYFCIDNLPTPLTTKFIDFCKDSDADFTKIALGIDIRIQDRETLKDFPKLIQLIKREIANVKIMFLESTTEVLIKRYKETRRKHPLSNDGDIVENVEKERKLLARIKEASNYLIDTSEYNVYELRDHINSIFLNIDTDRVSLSITSFGFKHGYPIDADIVMDARFLPNPYFIDSLKDLNGNDPEIKEFVLSRSETGDFIEKISDLLTFLIPKYKNVGKSYVNLAIGCTGGKHRSVVIANVLAESFKHIEPLVKHRDISK